ncbi:hypothetical protein [Pseudomonas sp. FSL R10-2398]|uniref:hypothetical protein n=1 Tax=Pseudomonas sp. FSL R10-2398 TaxID=2662201 RepID=UPI00129770DC|nr:hypothetical protein [Pseudomonas sp. FSL R10-2398]MQT50877.1 hypothetical protein [Pseudomonas sp. FSL R10-2398]
MKRILLYLLLAVMPAMAFAADTQEQIVQKIDEHEICSNQTQESFSKCANYNIEKSNFGYIESLNTPGSAAFTSLVVSQFTKNEVTVEPSKSTTGLNFLFELISTFGAILCELALVATVVVQLMRLKTGQHEGDFMGHGFGYAFINYAMIFGLVACGGLYTLIWGSLFAGILLGSYAATSWLPYLSDTTVNDPAAYQQRSENMATEQIGKIFDSMVRIADNNDRMRLSMYQNNLRIEGISVAFKDNAFSTCLKDSKPESDVIFIQSLKDGEITRSQKCLVTAGYASFDAGSVSYSGVQPVISNALIDLNKQARIYQYEYKKSLCTNALKVENKRDALKASFDPYADCLNVNSLGVPVLGENGIASFLPESDSSADSLKDIKKKALEAFSNEFAKYGVQVGTDMQNEKISGSSDFIKIFYSISTQQTGYKKWRSTMGDELAKIYSSSGSAISASMNSLGKSEEEEKARVSGLSGGLAKFKFIDRDTSLSQVLGDNSWINSQAIKSYILSAANYLGGNVFDDAGFTGLNCFATNNACQVPYLNQLAATSASNLAFAQSLFEAIVFVKLMYIGLEQSDPQSPWLGYLEILLMVLKADFTFSLLRILASLTPVIVLGGMMLATVSAALGMYICYMIDLIKYASPLPKNFKSVSLNGTIKSVFYGALWLLISFIVIMSLYLAVLVVYGILIVVVGYFAYTLGTGFIGESGEIINSVVNFCLVLFVFQLLDVTFILKLSSMAGRAVSLLQSYMCVNLNNHGLGEKMQAQISSQVQKLAHII